MMMSMVIMSMRATVAIIPTPIITTASVKNIVTTTTNPLALFAQVPRGWQAVPTSKGTQKCRCTIHTKNKWDWEGMG